VENAIRTKQQGESERNVRKNTEKRERHPKMGVVL
jgi:hypothetical protein